MFTARYRLNLLSVRLCFVFCFVFQVPIKIISCFLRQLIIMILELYRELRQALCSSTRRTFCRQSLLFYSNTLHITNTYIYPQQPATCFGVCYTNFRQTISLLFQQMYLLIWLYNSVIEFWPSQPTLSSLFHLGQWSSSLVLLSSVYLF
jgi:hypothetical protein